MNKKQIKKISLFGIIVLGLTIWQGGFAGGLIKKGLSDSVQEDDYGLFASGVFFKTPGTQNLSIVNKTKDLVAITSIAFADTPKNISDTNGINIDFSHCKVIAAGDNCVVTTSASADAHGSHQLNINYTINGQQKTLVTNVSVGVTQLALYEAVGAQYIPTDGELNIKPIARPQTFVVKNIGAFTWHGKIDWVGEQIPGVVKHDDHCNILSQGQTCLFRMIAETSTVPGSTATLRITGDTIDDINNNVVVYGDIALMPDENLQHKSYPAYSSIKMENTTNYDANITHVTIGKTLQDNRVKLCSLADANCFYKTEASCDMTGGALPAGKSCVIWFKSLSNESADIGQAKGNITVTAFVEWKPNAEQLKAQAKLPPNIKLGVTLPKQKTFMASYEQDLYAAGDFYGRVAKWDGNHWNTLGLGFYGSNPVTLRALAYTGRLITGGVFDTAEDQSANNIAAWNGRHWVALTTKAGNNGVRCTFSSPSSHCISPAFVTSLKTLDANQDKVAISGQFSYAGDYSVYGAGTFTKTDPTSGFSDFLGNHLGAIGSVNAYELIKSSTGTTIEYIGGSFKNTILDEHILNLGMYDSDFDTSSWLSVPREAHHDVSGPQGEVFALKALGSNLYIGGHFDCETYYHKCHFGNIAEWKWDGTKSTKGTFEYLGLTMSHGLDNAVRALEALNNNLYVGGDFISTGDGDIVSHIVEWDGKNWLPLGYGLNNSVYAIAAFNKNLYVGGGFTVSGITPLNRIAKWDGNNWSAFGDGLDGGAVKALTFGTTLMIANP